MSPPAVAAYCIAQVPDVVTSEKALRKGLDERGLYPTPIARIGVCGGLLVADKALQRRSKKASWLLRGVVAGWFLSLAVHNELEIRKRR